MNYVLKIAKEQAEIIKVALEEYRCLRMNQWSDFCADLARNIPEDNSEYQEYVKRRNESQELFEHAMDLACPNIDNTLNPVWGLQIQEIEKALYAEENSYVEALKVSKEQIEIVKVVLEEYFRLRMNQWFDFCTEVAFTGYEYNKEDPENDKRFMDCIERRNSSQSMFEHATRVAAPRIDAPQTIEMLRAQDIWQVIRHQLFLDREGEKNSWCVDAYEPRSISGEKLPEIKKEG